MKSSFIKCLFARYLFLILSVCTGSIAYAEHVGGGFHDGGGNYEGNAGYHDDQAVVGNYHPGVGWVAPAIVVNSNDGYTNNCQTTQQCDSYGNCTSTQECN